MSTLFSKLGRKGPGTPEPERRVFLKAGVTLVEILMAMAVLALGVAGILALQMQTIDAGSLASGRNMATFVAESQSEWLRTMDINRVAFVNQKPEKVTASGQLCSTAPTEPCLFTRTTTITKQVPTTTSYAVSIKVEWRNREIIYDTVVSGLGFF